MHMFWHRQYKNIREGNERFLIASDMERTTLISKLDDRVDEGNVKNNQRYIKGVDLSKDAVSAQDKVSPLNKPIMREIKNRLKF